MLSLLALALTLTLGPQETSGSQSGVVLDQIQLTNGRALTGRILFEGSDDYCIRVGRGVQEVQRKSIAAVRSIEHSVRDFIQRWDEMPRTDPRALADLARFCQSRGLYGEARNLWLRILITDPTSKEAAQGIGANPYGDSWQVNTSRGWVPLANYLGAKSSWNNAVELATAHFVVRTDLPLEKVLDATIQLERHYLRFYSVLGPELGLYVFAEVPEVNVYSNPKNYPYPPQAGDEAWFAYGNNQLHVLPKEPLDMRVIQRSVTAMMLYNALRQSSGHNGEMQPWAVRGLCEYFAATAGQKVGDPWAPLGTPSMVLFNQQANDPNPFPLYRLLITALSEFRSGPDGDRRSVYAYTLVNFLMNGYQNQFREAFFTYIRKGWLGAGSTGLLPQTLNMSQNELQNRWYQYVSDVANRR